MVLCLQYFARKGNENEANVRARTMAEGARPHAAFRCDRDDDSRVPFLQVRHALGKTLQLHRQCGSVCSEATLTRLDLRRALLL